MSTKSLVGESARKANVEKARKIVEKVTGNTDKATLSDASKTVVQEQKKGTAKKPSAKDLGVSGVVGNRGKLRSENTETPVPPPLHIGVPQEVLNCWFSEETHHFTAEGYGLARTIEKQLGKPWWSLAEKGESLPMLIGRAIKTMNDKPVVTQLTPTVTRVETPTQIVLSGPVKEYKDRVKQSVAASKPMTVNKPRGDGWNGYSSSAIFRWAGTQGWTKEDCIKAITALNLTGVGVGSLPTLLKAGKDGFRLPDMKPEHAHLLNVAAAKVTTQTHVKTKK